MFVFHVFAPEKGERLFKLLYLLFPFAKQAALCLHVGCGACEQHIGKKCCVVLQFLLPATDLPSTPLDLFQFVLYRNVTHSSLVFADRVVQFGVTLYAYAVALTIEVVDGCQFVVRYCVEVAAIGRPTGDAFHIHQLMPVVTKRVA